jgi:hypothetical protein
LEKIVCENREDNMMKILDTKQKRETIYRVRIERDDIIAWLRQQNGGIPSNADFWIGYDYSGSREESEEEFEAIELDVVISQ